jgi:hypothetical protein
MEPTKTPMLEYDPKEAERQEKRDNLSRFNMFLSMLNGSNENTFPFSMFAEGGKIHISPSKKGTFTAAASRHNMGVQEFASKVLANKDDYSPAMVKKANFARNARHWKHGLGGNLFDGTTQPSQKMQIGLDVQGWPNYTTEQLVAYGEENERRRKAIQDAYLNFVTESNDATSVANGRPQNQHLVDKEHRQCHHAHETERTGSTKEVIAVGVHRKENDKQHHPHHTPFVEAFQQVKVGRRQSRQGRQRTFLHFFEFECKNNMNP